MVNTQTLLLASHKQVLAGQIYGIHIVVIQFRLFHFERLCNLGSPNNINSKRLKIHSQYLPTEKVDYLKLYICIG